MESMHLPSPLIESGTDYTRIKLLWYPSFSDWSREDRVRTCYLSVCLKYVESIPASNAVLRERFGLNQSSSAIVSRIIGEAAESGLIRIQDESAGVKARRYVPYWA